MVGRNDPCPCGSGKKYKKCCLAKDKAARQAAQQTVEQNTFENLVDPSSDFGPEALSNAEDDPLLGRINAFFEAFLDTTYETQWEMATRALAEDPEIFDDETVFEVANTLFKQALVQGETVRFLQLLDKIQETAPEAYEQELPNMLDWRMQIALFEGEDAAVKALFNQASQIAGRSLDHYDRLISGLSYHGKLNILHEGLQLAFSSVSQDGDLDDWVLAEFMERLVFLDLLYLLEQNPDLTSAHLTDNFDRYDLTIVPEAMTTRLDYMTGRQKVTATTAENILSEAPNLSEESLDLLCNACFYEAHFQRGLSAAKVGMGLTELSRYVMFRQETSPFKTNRRQRQGKKSKRRSGRSRVFNPLCPDTKTMDQFLGELLQLFTFRYYEAYALFEIIPVWLDFLTKNHLLEESAAKETLKSLGGLGKDLQRVADAQLHDPLLKTNIARWPDV